MHAKAANKRKRNKKGKKIFYFSLKIIPHHCAISAMFFPLLNLSFIVEARPYHPQVNAFI